MRLIGSVTSREQVARLTQLLDGHNVAYTIEPYIVTDWGLATYGDRSWMVWITNEEDVPNAKNLYEQLLKESNLLSTEEPPVHLSQAPHPSTPELVPTFKQPPLKIITALLLLVCLICFAGSYLLTAPEARGDFFSTPLIPTDPVKEALLFDFPPYYAFFNKFIQTQLPHPIQNISEKQMENYEAKLKQQFEVRPVWQGFYSVALAYLKNQPWIDLLKTPRFEKIRQGEIWRLVTPIFLHQNLLHLLFNLLWIYLLGRQIEANLGAFRYIIFCIIVTVISNTAQYMMSGPNFLGISGLVCGMVTFIWVRMQQAGFRNNPTYFLTPGIFQGLMLFVFALLSMQVIAFILEATTTFTLPIGIANTAHFFGGLSGAFLATLPMFKSRS